MVFNLWVLGVRFFSGSVRIVRILTAVSFDFHTFAASNEKSVLNGTDAV
jgi:hypothetical protein